jgi:Spy/CpxP family protein refolding chaperone
MMIKTATRFALAVALGSAAMLAAAGPASAHGWLDRVQTKLQLTDDQMQAIRQIHDRDAETQRQLFRSLHQAQADLRRLALENTDPAAIEQKAAEIAGLQAQALQLRVRRLQEIAPLLTPEQRERFAQMPQGPAMRRPRHPHPQG